MNIFRPQKPYVFRPPKYSPLLAPLLKAMNDPDPEVRRRVREAILGLVPHLGREPLKGDTILSVNGTALSNYEVFLKALDPRRGWSGVKLRVMRGARILEITVK